MIVRLSHAQAGGVLHRVNEFYAEQLREHRVPRGRTQHDYDMPAIAWYNISAAMEAVCWGPMGGKRKGKERPSDSALLALQKINQALKEIEGHPALRGAAVEGWVGDVVPAWESACREWSPYPIPSNPVTLHYEMFALLIPQHEKRHGMRMTRWEASGSLMVRGEQSWTFRRESHLLFGRTAMRDRDTPVSTGSLASPRP